MKDRNLKDKLFEFKDLLCWFSENGYDISEIGGDSFAVTANYSRFDTGRTFHVGPGGVMQSVERLEEDEYPQYDHACFYGCTHPDHEGPEHP